MHYYTYAYLREDKTPYYIGKGQGNRIYKKGTGEVHPPKDKSRIIFLKQNLTEEQAFKHEIYMIDVFGRKDLGTGILRNMSDGGEGASGAIRSDEFRRKLSEAQKGNTKMLGKTHSEETRRKMSEAQKVKIFSEEHRTNISKANKNPSEETRKRMSEASKGENNPNYGKTASEETKKRMSVAHKNPSEEILKKLSENTKGTKWWTDSCGNRKRMVECPGNDWKLGRK